MKYLLPLLVLLPLLGCLDDDDQLDPLRDVQFTLNYRATYGGDPLGIQRETYGYPTGDSLKVLLFQYYVSDLELLPADGDDAVRLAEIDLIRWMSAAEDATQQRTYLVPPGDYRGLRFGLGVKPSLNARDPSEFAANYVLNEAEFWGPSTRYVFAKIEANAMLEDDGRFDTGLSYHMGSDALYRTVSLEQPFTVGGNETPTLTLTADVLRALSGNGQTFDITSPDKQTVHGGNQEVATGIWNRLAGQFTLSVE
ncbi:MbnP family protein [Neolewinella litorea]|uniref:Copper-binding protein MbnP-like domain-containing protein n=1 Tax=Neolewinella litorea TaxID=2562452 RepID=A0A4S4NDK3_9BACT|nr:MbnP family protein [Neolewinella litorea]THH37596.1 hypothetical protein E4021_14330 [Neolewinella litorea]